MPEQIENAMVVAVDYHTRRIINQCDLCGGSIYEEDDFYCFDNEIVCESCIDAFVKEHRVLGGL